MDDSKDHDCYINSTVNIGTWRKTQGLTNFHCQGLGDNQASDTERSQRLCRALHVYLVLTSRDLLVIRFIVYIVADGYFLDFHLKNKFIFYQNLNCVHVQHSVFLSWFCFFKGLYDTQVTIKVPGPNLNLFLLPTIMNTISASHEWLTVLFHKMPLLDLI